MCAKKKSELKSNLLFSDSFYSDLTKENMLYASIVRSSFSKGRIISISHNQLPDNYLFFRWDDIPGKKSVKILDTEIPLFCRHDIDFLGQPIGIITGPNRKTVRKLSKNLPITIDEHFLYEDDEAEKSNLLAQRTVQFGQDYEKSDDEIVVEEEWESDINVQNYSETNGALCYVEGKKLHVYSPNLWTSNLRETLSDVTGFDEENIIITRTKLLDKNTNIIWLNSLIACQCAIAAIKLKRPVKLEYTRSEQEQYAENTSSVKINHKTTVTRQGLIKNMEINIHVNAGPYNPFAQEIADRLAISSMGVYNCPNLRITSNIYKSHSIPSSIDFSIIDSKAFFAVENQMNKIAQVTGIDPLEIRLLNLKQTDNHNKSNILLETGKSKEALEAISAKSIFLRKNAVYKMADKYRFKLDNASPYAPPLRGIGLACAYDGTGYLGSSFIKKSLNIELTYTEDKKLYIRGIPSSQNIWAIWQKLASSITNIPVEDVILDTNFNSETEPENPQTTDASISINTQLIKKASETMAKKIKTETAFPIIVKKAFSVNTKKNWNSETFTGYPFSSTSFAAMVIELELEAAVYKPLLRGVWFIVDAGKILNVKTAETSIKNSIQEGLRELIEDDEIEAPSISIQFIQSDDEPKQIGEIVTSILPAAFSSALSQCVGKTIDHLPVQTDTVFKLTEALKREYELKILEQKKLQEASASNTKKETDSSGETR